MGDLRFKSPQPFIAKDGFYDVSDKSKVKCPQFNFLTKALTGQEDCLILNVYVPEKAFSSKPDTKLPVMVWIHGGALVFGNFLRLTKYVHSILNTYFLNSAVHLLFSRRQQL